VVEKVRVSSRRLLQLGLGRFLSRWTSARSFDHALELRLELRLVPFPLNLSSFNETLHPFGTFFKVRLMLSATGVSDSRETLPSAAPGLAGVFRAHVVIAGKD
jgi:hypothetical protein